MEKYYINNQVYSLEEIQSLSLQDYLALSQKNKPMKLYKYFPNLVENGRNYSIEALENNSVYLQSPINFDDPYDATVSIDVEEFAMNRIEYYASRCGYNLEPHWDYSKRIYEFSTYLYNQLLQGKTLHDILNVREKTDDLADITHSIFANQLNVKLIEHYKDNDAWQQAFYKAIHEQFLTLKKHLIGYFRVSCFTTTPYSMLMWSHYADSHKGFCIEYEYPAYDERYKDLYANLFPVMYSEHRISVLEECIRHIDHPRDATVLYAIYKYGLLAKSIDWKYQNEWRLISLDDMLANDKNYNCKFFPISKVYLGSKMLPEEKRGIINLCNKKGIPYMCLSLSSNKYELRDCSMCKKIEMKYP